jgi:thioredoxin 1
MASVYSNGSRLKRRDRKISNLIKKIMLQMILLLIGHTAFIPSVCHSESFANLPAKGIVTMIDLGAKKCIPCKMMAPILEKMEEMYQGKAVIAFIDVWEHREQAQRFGIRAIPTQIFFNKEGKEVYRHAGFMSEKDIKSQLDKMGVTPPTEKKN